PGHGLPRGDAERPRRGPAGSAAGDDLTFPHIRTDNGDNSMSKFDAGSFGTDIRGLGYVKIQTNDMERWRKFAFEVLGFAQGSGPEENALYLRMDERSARIVVVPGEDDRV